MSVEKFEPLHPKFDYITDFSKAPNSRKLWRSEVSQIPLQSLFYRGEPLLKKLCSESRIYYLRNLSDSTRILSVFWSRDDTNFTMLVDATLDLKFKRYYVCRIGHSGDTWLTAVRWTVLKDADIPKPGIDSIRLFT